MIPTSLYQLPRFLLTALPPSPQLVPSTHAPSRNHVCSLRRSITEYSLELFMELPPASPQFLNVENDDNCDETSETMTTDYDGNAFTADATPAH